MDVNGDELGQLEEIQLEEALRQFQPRRPRPLRALERPRRAWPRILAIAAVLLLGVAAVLFRASRPSSPPVVDARATPIEAPPEAVAVALGPLTALAAEHPEQLDEALTRGSRALLPDLETAGGGLEQLAKE
jgi:hypothetical protein